MRKLILKAIVFPYNLVAKITVIRKKNIQFTTPIFTLIIKELLFLSLYIIFPLQYKPIPINPPTNILFILQKYKQLSIYSKRMLQTAFSIYKCKKRLAITQLLL